MYCGSHSWIIFPLVFFGIMILCMVFSRRRGRWSCHFPYDRRYDYRDRIRKLEDEIERLRGE
jgi:hypothetical protein